MPYEIKKLPTGKFQLILKSTGEILAKSTTKEKAQKQIQAIEASKYNKKVVKKKK
jgi:uncharacterized protein YegP (UPF0339 family)